MDAQNKEITHYEGSVMIEVGDLVKRSVPVLDEFYKPHPHRVCAVCLLVKDGTWYEENKVETEFLFLEGEPEEIQSLLLKAGFDTEQELIVWLNKQRFKRQCTRGKIMMKVL